MSRNSSDSESWTTVTDGDSMDNENNNNIESQTSATSSNASRAVRGVLTVRFQDACVLIPDANFSSSKSGIRVFAFRSFSFPIWKANNNKQDNNVPKSDETTKLTLKIFSITLTLPGFKKKSTTLDIPTLECGTTSTQKSRPRPASLPPPINPSVPTPKRNTSTRAPPSSFPIDSMPKKVTRVRSFPAVLPASLPSSNTATIPLRPCCAECEAKVDKCLAQANWSPRWSRGARRRYSENDPAVLNLAVRRMVNPPNGKKSISDALVDEVEAKYRSTAHDSVLNHHNVPTSPNAPSLASAVPRHQVIIIQGNESKEEQADIVPPLPTRVVKPFDPSDLDPEGPDPDALPPSMLLQMQQDTTPESSRPNSRRTSLNTISESLFKGSVSAIRGFSWGMGATATDV